MSTKNTGGESGSSSNQQGGQDTVGGKSGHAGQSGADRKNQPRPAGEQPSGSERDTRQGRD